MLKIYTYHPSRISNELSAIVQNAVLPGLKTGLEKLGIDYDYQPNKPIANGDDHCRQIRRTKLGRF
ncbi:hypothetical protein [Psychrobacter sp. BI730]|uniref:hypothetical protein n=1 Tax=Psychrobacter sp. BI730 TaxID=2705463 RepID=UPI0015C97198|nr:hypothetical protein [Psychrobacter sp. BI730]NYR10864.1 hypothetical protein [Psychrobacter sp. BI730]